MSIPSNNNIGGFSQREYEALVEKHIVYGKKIDPDAEYISKENVLYICEQVALETRRECHHYGKGLTKWTWEQVAVWINKVIKDSFNKTLRNKI